MADSSDEGCGCLLLILAIFLAVLLVAYEQGSLLD